MAKGGYRANSGPVKGAIYKEVTKRPRKVHPPEVATVAVKPKKAEKAKPGVDIPAEETPILDNDTPLEYILKVMNDTSKDTNTRLKAASLAAPFIHSRKGEGNKKEERGDKAKAAGTGKFAASPPPLRVIK